VIILRPRRRKLKDEIDPTLWKELRMFLFRLFVERIKTKLAGAAIVGAVASTQVSDGDQAAKQVPPPPPPPRTTQVQEKAPE